MNRKSNKNYFPEKIVPHPKTRLEMLTHLSNHCNLTDLGDYCKAF